MNFLLKNLLWPKSHPLYLHENFLAAARSAPATPIHFDKPLNAFPELGTHTTYAESAQSVAELATRIIEAGIAPGEHVGVFKSASFDSYLTAVALSYAGAVPVMISPHLTADTLSAMAGRLSDPWLIYDYTTESKIKAVETVKPEKKIDLIELQRGSVAAVAPPAGRRPMHDIAYMTHTSGTTGIPKLIAHSPTSMGWRVTWQRRILSLVDNRGIAAFHVSAVHSRFNIGIASLMSFEFPMLVIADPSEDNVEQLMRCYRPLTLETHPNDFMRWASLVDKDPDIFSSVKYLHSTFDAINKSTMFAFLRASKYRMPVFLQVYGQSECGPMVLRAHTRQSLRFTNMRSMGVGMPSLTKVRVVDQNGRKRRRGEQGAIEMFSRGRAITYYNEDERFQSNLHGDWWNSGDVGKIDRFGSLWLHDRQVDVNDGIESNLELEDVLLDQLPFLNEVVIVRGTDGGPQPVVSVVDGKEFDWGEWWKCVSDMPRFNRPIIMRYEELPRTATAKVQRRQLEAVLGSGTANS
ncbi:class I adenylate-forming enzyme family protein [Amycolatopsis taiwanensis]|uniref:Acetate--CoA ligase n=1 Tax=Amycolatopsis taiwanensis TaxID=342230 RepID=A0A9W6VLD0_9PSEU|nr:AMP-binding protein [Amycolatopsis taiwanensis]GLY71514.1 acetate--CoA ligase [Amycolatopsis taiwanensis]